MKLAWAVFWRVLVLLLAFSVLVVLPLRSSAFITDPRFFTWKTSVLWIAFAVIILLAQAALPHGLVHTLWGKRLNQGAVFWRKLSFATAALFVCLAIVSIVLAQVLSFESWLRIRTAAPFAGLLLFVLVIPRRLAVQPHPTLEAAILPSGVPVKGS